MKEKKVIPLYETGARVVLQIVALADRDLAAVTEVVAGSGPQPDRSERELTSGLFCRGQLWTARAKGLLQPLFRMKLMDSIQAEQ